MTSTDRKFVEVVIRKLSDKSTGIEDGAFDYNAFEYLKEYYETKGHLTPKQLKLLTDIFERN